MEADTKTDITVDVEDSITLSKLEPRTSTSSLLMPRQENKHRLSYFHGEPCFPVLVFVCVCVCVCWFAVFAFELVVGGLLAGFTARSVRPRA